MQGSRMQLTQGLVRLRELKTLACEVGIQQLPFNSYTKWFYNMTFVISERLHATIILQSNII